MNVINQAKQLAESIKQTEQYKSYIGAKNRICEDSSAKKIINDMNSQMKLIEGSAADGSSVEEAVIDRYEELQQEAMNNEIIKSYYEKEEEFSELMNEISQIISDTVEI